jgi:hypothetical protein
MEVVATRPRAIPVEHHVGPHAPRAARTDGAQVRERRKVGLLEGRGGHGRPHAPAYGIVQRSKESESVEGLYRVVP